MDAISKRTKIAELASDRRVAARALPFDLAVAGSFGTAILLSDTRELGLWFFFITALVLGGGWAFSVVSTTRELLGTRPEERGKRSDDKALAKAQRSLGCLPVLIIGGFGAAGWFRLLNGRWPVEPWIVAAGGVAGHLTGVAIIAWCRREQNSLELQ